MEFTSSSIRHRGNRNKAILMRERREQLKQKRTAGYRRCGRVSSKEVGQLERSSPVPAFGKG